MADINSYVALELHKNISEDAISWLIAKIQADKMEHGCQLNISSRKLEDEKTLALVSASDFRKRVGAEIFGIKKKYNDGSMREFNMADQHNFIGYLDDDFITESEALYIIKSELDLLRATDDDGHIPGHENIRLYPGKSILRKLKSSNLLTNIACLHNPTKLDKLGMGWYKNKSLTLEQPTDEIHSYFGDSITMYFSFLGYYTKALIPLVVFALPFYLTSSYWGQVESYSGYAMLNLIWASVFLELWKRKSAELAYKFGTFQKREWEEPRGSYRGPLGINPITGKQEPSYPDWKRKLRICFITGPIITLCIMSAVSLMFYYFSWDAYFAAKYDKVGTIMSKLLRNIPSIVYSVLVLAANLFYRKLAEYLTDRENHRLESSYQNFLITKIVLFDFVNNFLCLFYIAFVYNDMKMLCRTLRNLFLIQIIISQTMESLVPYWTYRHRVGDTKENKENDEPESQAAIDLKRDIYSGTFDDYLEMWLQFGYVVMFSCVFPFASILALINNVIEIRSDAFKMCKVFRRPDSLPTRNIGAWQVAFEIISYLGVISNIALIFQSEGFQKWFYTQDSSADAVTLLIAFFLAEHSLLAVRYALSTLIPSVPEHINIAIARMKYRSLQALKRQRSASLPPSEMLRKKLHLLRAKAARSNETNESTSE
ncbi:anoctamin-10-like [Styela clava]